MRALWIATILASSSCVARGAPERDAPAATQRSGLVVSDAATPRAQLEQWLSRDPKSLQQVERSDGVRQVRITNGFQHATVIVRDQEGNRSQHCVDSADDAVLREAAP